MLFSALDFKLTSDLIFARLAFAALSGHASAQNDNQTNGVLL